eukprot:763116-Hanusia_phi.AAC.3
MMSSMACMARPPCFSHFHAVYASRRVPLCGRLPLPTKLHRYHAARSRIVSQARDRGQEGASKRDIRVYVGGQQLMDGSTVSFAPSQGHYLEKVMRVMEGSQVKVFNGCDGEWWCRIDHFDKKGARGAVVSFLPLSASYLATQAPSSSRGTASRQEATSGLCSHPSRVTPPKRSFRRSAPASCILFVPAPLILLREQATELGVRGILPVSTQVSLLQADGATERLYSERSSSPSSSRGFRPSL